MFNQDNLILVGGSGSATRLYMYVNKTADDVTTTSYFSERDLNLGDQVIVVSGEGYNNCALYSVTATNNLDATVTLSVLKVGTFASLTATILNATTVNATTVNATTANITTLDLGTNTITDGNLTGAWAGLTNLTMSGTLDLGTNTIYDGNMTGNWALNGGNVSGVGTIGCGAITSTGQHIFTKGSVLPDNGGIAHYSNDILYIKGGTAGVTLFNSGNDTLSVSSTSTKFERNNVNMFEMTDTLHTFKSGKVQVDDTSADSIKTAGGISVAGKVNLSTDAELTIASGAITITKSFHRVDTEGDSASDNLTTINGGAEGDILILRAEDSARTVVVKDGGGNLLLSGDFSLDNVQDTITLINIDGTNWGEISRSDNAA